MDAADHARFMASLGTDGECVLWDGSISSKKVPVFMLGPRSARTNRSARLIMFELLNGWKPTAVRVTCGNQMCVLHLESRQQPPEARAHSQLLWRNRQMGVKSMVPAGPASDHIRMLHDTHSMSYTRIAELADMSDVGVVNFAHGDCQTMHRQRSDRILSILPDLKAVGQGAPADAIGCRRRLQALQYAGFGRRFLAVRVGISLPGFDCILKGATAARSSDTVRAKTAESIRALYTDIIDLRPETFGVSHRQSAWAQTIARRAGFAPAHCWDADTIDDPQAFAEWTGECGSEAGWNIHKREQIPSCQPCRTAHGTYNALHVRKHSKQINI